MKDFIQRKSHTEARRASPFFAKASFIGANEKSFVVSSGRQQSAVQTKLRIGEPGDRFEQEADAAADTFVNAKQEGFSISSDHTSTAIQNKCVECEKDSAGGRRTSNRAVNKSFQSDHGATLAAHAVAGGGQALSNSTRNNFETHYGQNLSDVRVHTDASAATAARSIQARAYTLGNHIAFAEGEYSPDTKRGQHLLAHELAHTIQQRGAARNIQRYNTTDCTEDNRATIRNAVTRARAMLNNAITLLTADPVTAETQTHFANHFGAWGEWRRDIVVGHFRRDLEILAGDSLQFQCESECDEDDRAYTYWIFGDVHLCPNWIDDSDRTEQAETVIHELHHWDPERGHFDLGYHGNDENADTVWIVAVNNADSYSELAQDLY